MRALTPRGPVSILSDVRCELDGAERFLNGNPIVRRFDPNNGISRCSPAHIQASGDLSTGFQKRVYTKHSLWHDSARKLLANQGNGNMFALSKTYIGIGSSYSVL